MANQKTLKINILSSLKRDQGFSTMLGFFRNLKNLVGSSMRAVFRTTVVAGFFLAIRKGFQTIDTLKSAIASLGKGFIDLRLKAAETAGIISGGGSTFNEVFQEAITMSRALSNEIGRSSLEIQEGLITAARSGLGLADSFKVTNSAMQLAVSNGMEFQGTLNDLIATTRAFGVELEDVPKFADALTQAVRSSLTSLQGLFAGLKRVGAIAATAFGEGEKTFLDTSAALMTLNDAGIQGEKGGTRLRSFMTKLVSETTQVAGAFTKYGVNVFDAHGKSQKYLGTMLSGAKAMQSTKDKLNALKNKQFEMILANKEGTQGYKDLEDSIDSTSSKLQGLEKGTDKVFKEFQLTGGKLKSFSKLLNDIAKNVPSEVLAKVFGIRGGQAGTVLVNNIKKFNEFKKTLEEVSKASEKGESLLGDIYGKFLQTFGVRFMKMKNTAINIFGEIADGALESFAPLFDPIQRGLDAIFDTVSKHKGFFKAMFKGAAESLKPVFDLLEALMTNAASSMTDIFKGESWTVDVIGLKRVKKEAGGESTGLDTYTTTVEGTTGEMLMGLVRVFSSSLIAALTVGLEQIKGELNTLAALFATIFATGIQAKIEIFKAIGVKLGASMAAGMITTLKAGLPGIISAIGSSTKDVGKQAILNAVGISNKNSTPEQKAKATATRRAIINSVPTPAEALRTVTNPTLAIGENVVKGLKAMSGTKELTGFGKNLEDAVNFISLGMDNAFKSSENAKKKAATVSRNIHQEKNKLY